jgi:cell division protease FtsH
MCLLNDIPSEITARTADSFMEGYVSFDIKDKVITKRDIELYAARLLAGLEAERLIFGEELITLGSSTDLKVVTRQVLMALSENGFGEKIGYYAQKGLFGQHVLEEGLKDLEEEAEHIISKAQLITRERLSTERQMLLAISEQLLNKQKLNGDDMANLIKTYAVSFSLEQLEQSASEEPHWKQLKNELNSLGDFKEHREENRISA